MSGMTVAEGQSRPAINEQSSSSSWWPGMRQLPGPMMTSNLPIYQDNGYKVMAGWRVGHAPEESTTRSGLLVPIGTKDGNDALALVDVKTGQRFWAVPTGAWRFIWPSTGKPVIAVRESQIIAEEEIDHVGDEGQYL
jgi:hypothetical protein